MACAIYAFDFTGKSGGEPKILLLYFSAEKRKRPDASPKELIVLPGVPEIGSVRLFRSHLRGSW